MYPAGIWSTASTLVASSGPLLFIVSVKTTVSPTLTGVVGATVLIKDKSADSIDI